MQFCFGAKPINNLTYEPYCIIETQISQRPKDPNISHRYQKKLYSQSIQEIDRAMAHGGDRLQADQIANIE